MKKPIKTHICSLSLWHQLTCVMWPSGVFASVCPGTHRAQRVCFQAVLLCQDEPRCGEDRHDSTTALPSDRWTTGICGGGTVPRSRGETEKWTKEWDLNKQKKIYKEKNKVISVQTRNLKKSRSRSLILSFPIGSESFLGSLPAPANSQPEAACSRS